MLNVEDGFLEQVADVGVVERVDRPSPDSLSYNKPEMAQQPQLMRDRRLLHLERVREVTYRAGCLAQAGENPNSAAGCERLHRLRHLPGGIDIKQSYRRVTMNAVTHTQDHMHIRSSNWVGFDASFPLLRAFLG